jgi:hypothetical protein
LIIMLEKFNNSVLFYNAIVFFWLNLYFILFLIWSQFFKPLLLFIFLEKDLLNKLFFLEINKDLIQKGIEFTFIFFYWDWLFFLLFLYFKLVFFLIFFDENEKKINFYEHLKNKKIYVYIKYYHYFNIFKYCLWSFTTLIRFFFPSLDYLNIFLAIFSLIIFFLNIIIFFFKFINK